MATKHMPPQHLVQSPSPSTAAGAYRQNDEPNDGRHVARLAAGASLKISLFARRLLQRINEVAVVPSDVLPHVLKMLANDDDFQSLQNDILMENVSKITPNQRDSNISTNSSRSSSGSMLPSQSILATDHQTQDLGWSGVTKESALRADKFPFTRPSHTNQRYSNSKPRKRIYKCTHCDAFFYSDWKSYLLHERRVHDVASSQQCLCCGTRFRTAEDAQRHHAQAHAGSCNRGDCFAEVLDYSLALVDGVNGILVDLRAWRHDPDKSAAENQKSREAFLFNSFYCFFRIEIPEYMQGLTDEELSRDCSQVWKRSNIARGFLSHQMMSDEWHGISGGLDIESLNWDAIEHKQWSYLQRRWELSALISKEYAAQAVACAWNLIRTVDNPDARKTNMSSVTADTPGLQGHHQAEIGSGSTGTTPTYANYPRQNVEDISTAARRIPQQPTATSSSVSQHQAGLLPVQSPSLATSHAGSSSSPPRRAQLAQNPEDNPYRMSFTFDECDKLSPANLTSYLNSLDVAGTMRWMEPSIDHGTVPGFDLQNKL